MKGIQYLMDEDGVKRAVVIDLKRHGELWEDIYDSLVASERRNEPRESLAQVKRRLRRAGKPARKDAPSSHGGFTNKQT